MAYALNGNNNGVRVDRFGNPTKLVKCTANKNGFPVGYLEIGGKLFKVEPSQASSGKEDKRGRPVLAWVKITAVPKRPQNRQSF